MKEFYAWKTPSLVEDLYSLPANQKVIVYAAEEQIINDEFEPTIMKDQESIDFLFGSVWYHKFEHYKETVKLHFWSNFWLYKTLAEINLKNIKNSKNKRLFISLNNRAHYHRCKMIDVLQKEKLLEHGIISWYNKDREKYKFKHWKQRKVFLKDNYKTDRDQHVLPGEFNKAFLNLVTESTTDGIFVTEKTYHPILIKRPFICLAALGFHNFLKTQGFQLYDEIINYKFDDEEDLDKRIALIAQELKNLQKQNYQILYNKIRNKLEFNKRRALEIVKNQEGIPDIAFTSKYYQGIIKEAQCRLDTLV